MQLRRPLAQVTPQSRRGTSHPSRASNPPALGMAGIMRLPEPRGPLSVALASDLATRPALSAATLGRADGMDVVAVSALTDEDLQLSLAICYELHYRGFDEVPDHWEWEPGLLRIRAALEQRRLAALRDLVGPVPVTEESIDGQLAAVIAADDGPSLSAYMAKTGTLEQWR